MAQKIATEKYNNLIVCGPIWAGKPAPAVIKLLENLGIKNKNISCNFTYTQDYGETEAQIAELITRNGGISDEIVFWNIRSEEKA